MLAVTGCKTVPRPLQVTIVQPSESTSTRVAEMQVRGIALVGGKHQANIVSYGADMSKKGDAMLLVQWSGAPDNVHQYDVISFEIEGVNAYGDGLTIIDGRNVRVDR
jgi:hypothetical protein